jgi:hypothetical protein
MGTRAHSDNTRTFCDQRWPTTSHNEYHFAELLFNHLRDGSQRT